MRKIYVLIFLFIGLIYTLPVASQVVNYNMQTVNFNNVFVIDTDDNYYAGSFNNNNSQIGLYANGDGSPAKFPGVSIFQIFTSDGSGNVSNARPLTVGDHFQITAHVANSSSFFDDGTIGITFNENTSFTEFDAFNSNVRARFQMDKNGNWYIAAPTNLSGYPTPGQDVTFSFTLTSTKTGILSLVGINNGDVTHYDINLDGSPTSNTPITSFALWNRASGGNNDVFWKNGSLQNLGYVEFGKDNKDLELTGVISDGKIANSTTEIQSIEVRKYGTGTLTLDTANTYNGHTNIHEGKVVLNNEKALGNVSEGTTVYSGAVLELNAGTDYPAEHLYLNGTGINHEGALRKIKTGNQKFQGNITLQSDVRINVTGGTLDFMGEMDFNSHTLYIGGNQNFNFQNTNSIKNANKTEDNGAIYKDGSGNLIIRPTLDLTGNIILAEGTIGQGPGSYPENTGVIIMRNNTTYRGDGNGARKIAKKLQIEGNVTLGTTIASHNSSGNNIATLEANHEIDLANDIRTIQCLVDDISKRYILFSGEVKNGGMIKAGSATLQLSNDNSFSDDTRIAAGKLELANQNALKNSTLDLQSSDLGQLVFGSGTTFILGGLKGDRSLNMSAKTLKIGNNNQNTSYSGVLSNGSLTKVGTGELVLSGSNTYSGATTIEKGKIILNNDNAISVSSDIILAGGTINSSGYDQSFGKLKVIQNSAIDLGSSSHTINFSPSNTEAWASSAKLTITGWTGEPGSPGTGSRIFVGTDNSGLTGDQLVQIVFEGYYMGAEILSNGELVPRIQTTTLFEDFNRDNSDIVGEPSSNPGGSWIESGEPIGYDNYISISEDMLEMRNCTSSVSGSGEGHTGNKSAAFDMTGLYNTVFEEADGVMEWYFNMRQGRPDPGGLRSGAYGIGFILGATASDFGSTSIDGYAVVLGESYPNDPIRLIYFTDSIKTPTNDNTIAKVTLPNDHRDKYYSIKVTFNPCTFEWTMHVRDDGASAFNDPTSSSGTFQSASGFDNSLTDKELKYMGGYYSHADGCNQSTNKAFFDNIYIPTTESMSPITYTWAGGTPGDYQISTNWYPERTCPKRTDKIVFDGGNYEVTHVPDETIGQFILQNAAQVTLRPNGSIILKIKGGDGNDFLVNENTVLNFDVTNNADSIKLELLSNTTGEVKGNINLNNTVNASPPKHKILVTDSYALRIKSNGVISANKLSGNLFGKTGVENVVIFENGSKYISQSGANPFGFAANSEKSKIIFEPGSWYEYIANDTPPMSGRKYANFKYDPTTTNSIKNLTGSNSYYIDTLYVIKNGLNFTLETTGTIKGDIYVASDASLSFNPSTTVQNLEFKGSVTQRIYGNGNLTFGDSLNVVIDKPSSTDSVIIDKELTIQRNFFIKKGWVASNQKLTVDKNVVVGEGADEGRLSLSPVFGGDLELGGDFIINAKGIFNPNNRAVFFTGNTNQTITSHNTADNNEVTFNYMVVNKPEGDLILDSSPGTTVNVNGSTGDVLVLTRGDIDLNGQIFNLGGNGGEIKVEGSIGSSRTIKSNVAANFHFTGNKKVSSQGSLELIFDDSITVALTTTSAQIFGVDFGAGNPTVVKGTLRIDQHGYVDGNSPHYGVEGILQYNTNGVYRRRLEWQNTEGNAGFPNHVIIGGNTILDAGGENGENVLKEFGARLDVRIDNGSSLYMDYGGHHMKVPLKVGRDLIIHGNLSASDSPGGDIHVGRDWLRTATGVFTPNNRQVLFNGTGPQTITAPGVAGETFDWLGFDSIGTKTLNSNITVNKKLEIFENSGTLQAGDKTITLKGDWENNAGINGFDRQTSTVIFEGTAEQKVEASAGKENFYNVEIKNTSEKIEGVQMVDADMNIFGGLNLTTGLIHPGENLVHFQSGATSTQGNNDSYINGKARKTWGENTDPFVFPVGQLKDTIDVYQPAGLTPEGNNAEFTVDYFHENYFPGTWVPGNPPPMASSLETVSGCDYWNIDRTGGSPGAKVRLYWSEKCFDIQEPGALVVARYNGTTWQSEGQSTVQPDGSTAPYESGYVETTGFVSAFSPFAIGSSSSINVLPIELISFDAMVRGGVVETHWVTATEKNNAYFTVERSVDARHFTEMGRVEGAGNSTVKLTYSLTDPAPYTGISYYRLKQTDFDGNYTYSEIRSVRIDRDSKFELIKAYRSEVGLHLAYRSEAELLHAEIFDLVGKKIYRTQIHNTNGFSTIHPNLVRGIYLLRLSNGVETVAEKFFW